MSMVSAEIYQSVMTPLPKLTPKKRTEYNPRVNYNNRIERLKILEKNVQELFQLAVVDKDSVERYLAGEKNLVDPEVFRTLLCQAIKALGKTEGRKIAKCFIDEESLKLKSGGITCVNDGESLSFTWSDPRTVLDDYLQSLNLMIPWQELVTTNEFQELPELKGIPENMRGKENVYLNGEYKLIIQICEKNLTYAILDELRTVAAQEDFLTTEEHSHVMNPELIERVKKQLVERMKVVKGNKAFWSIYDKLSIELSRKLKIKLDRQETDDGTVYIAIDLDGKTSPVQMCISGIDWRGQDKPSQEDGKGETEES